jgi:hypothetical protein
MGGDEVTNLSAETFGGPERSAFDREGILV